MHLLPGPQQQGILFPAQGQIAKPLKPLRSIAGSGQRPHHGPERPMGVLQGLLQIEEAAAFCHRRHTGLDAASNFPSKGLIFRQLWEIQLRVTAAQIKTVYVRKRLVPQRTEIAELRSGALQRIQIVLIIKGKRCIHGYGNSTSYRRFFQLSQQLRAWSLRRQLQQLWQLHMGLQLRRNGIKSCREVLDLFRRYQSQMPGWNVRLLHGRQIPQHREPGFPLQDRTQMGKQHRLAVRQ